MAIDLISDVHTRVFVRKNYPKVTITRKSDSRFMRIIAFLIGWFNKSFMESFTTTIHHRIYVPSSWDSMGVNSQIRVIYHEIEHVKQYEKYWLLFDLLYLLVLPFGISFRYYFERDAYLVSVSMGADIDRVVDQLCGPNYLWAGLLWPGKKRTKKWFEDNT